MATRSWQTPFNYSFTHFIHLVSAFPFTANNAHYSIEVNRDGENILGMQKWLKIKEKKEIIFLFPVHCFIVWPAPKDGEAEPFSPEGTKLFATFVEGKI